MVRATVGEVTKLFGGTLPANWTTGANVTNLCTIVEGVVDGKTYPIVLGTSVACKALSNEIVARYMMWGNWMHAGSPAAEEPVIWTQDLIDRLEQLSRSGTEGTAVYMKMQEES